MHKRAEVVGSSFRRASLRCETVLWRDAGVLFIPYCEQGYLVMPRTESPL